MSAEDVTLGDTSGTGTSAEGSQAASEALSGQSASFSDARTLTPAELERREQVAALLWDTDREANTLGIPFAAQRQSVKNVYLQAAQLTMRFLDTYDDHGGRVDLVRDSAP